MTEPPRTPPPARRRRWALGLVVLAAGGLALVVGVVQIWDAERREKDEAERRHAPSLAEAEVRLAAAVAEAERLDGPWQLEDLEARREQVPDDENSAGVLAVVKEKMPARWPSWSYWQPPAPPPDFDRDTLKNLLPPVLLNPAQFGELRGEMDRAADALAAARQLAGRPRGRLAFAWSKDVLATLKEFPDVTAATGLLSYDSRLRAQDGESEVAVASCVAHLNIASAIADVPTPGAQIVRDRIHFAVCRELEHVLALGEPPEKALASVQARLTAEADLPLALPAVRGQRAAFDRFCQALLSGEVPVADWLGDGKEPQRPKTAEQAAADRVAIAHARALLLERMNRLVEIAKLPPERQDEPLTELWKASREDPPLVRKLVTPVVTTWDRHDPARLRCAAAAVAVERFRQKFGRWPDRLADLVPEFLAAVPPDTFDGAPLRYGRHEEGVTVYSVGRDGVDGGGFLKREGVLKDPDDVGFQLWQPGRRRQPPE